MRNLIINWRWLIPMLAYSADAHAWGLYTHVYYAQLLLWAVPLTDPRYYRAIKQFPTLVLAGACLPDLSLFAKQCGVNKLTDSHLWDHAHHLLRCADSDAERAVALGYTSHLLVDIIAHNHFVPAHERMWLDIPTATHAVAEWAMDHHLRRQLYLSPAELLRRHETELAQYVACNFGCHVNAAGKAVRLLGRAEALLRHSGIPRLCYRVARRVDLSVSRRFNYYLSQTSARLRHINRVLAGDVPSWLAEPVCAKTTRQRIETVHHLKLRHRMPLPHDLFASAEIS